MSYPKLKCGIGHTLFAWSVLPHGSGGGSNYDGSGEKKTTHNEKQLLAPRATVSECAQHREG